MNQTETFAWGCLGSVAVEAYLYLKCFYSKPIIVPERYSRWTFWLARVLWVVIGGGLAVALNPQQPWVAVGIGAATPAIVQRLIRTGGRAAGGG